MSPRPQSGQHPAAQGSSARQTRSRRMRMHGGDVFPSQRLRVSFGGSSDWLACLVYSLAGLPAPDKHGAGPGPAVNNTSLASEHCDWGENA